jgi:hypothetical protein
MDQKQDGNWCKFTTFVRRPSSASLFGMTITGGENSSIYIKRIDPQMAVLIYVVSISFFR